MTKACILFCFNSAYFNFHIYGETTYVYSYSIHECISYISILETKPMLLIYTDGGPDHRLTYLSVQLSLIALFLQLDLDVLIAARTAPCHSWANPVERVMSIVNLGLQCVGMMRQKQSVGFEANISMLTLLYLVI